MSLTNRRFVFYKTKMITATEAKTLSETSNAIDINTKIHLENIEKEIINSCKNNLCFNEYDITNLFTPIYDGILKSKQKLPGLTEKITSELENYGYTVSMICKKSLNNLSSVYLNISWAYKSIRS